VRLPCREATALAPHPRNSANMPPSANVAHHGAYTRAISRSSREFRMNPSAGEIAW